MEGAASASARRVRKDGGYYAWMEGGRGGATVWSGEISRKIQSLLGQLTDRQREAVCLRYIYDMEYKEIAQIMKMENEKSARNLVSRAIQKLKLENTYLLFFLPFIKLN